MVSLKSLVTFGLLGLVAGSGASNYPGCGKVDVVFTGLPANHPLVTSQGFDPAVVQAAMKADAASIIKAGYNLRVVLFGPEKPIDVLCQSMSGISWEGAGVGYGVRGSRLPNLTIQLENIIQTYRDRAPRAPIVFNFSPNTSLWAIQRRLPLSSDCANSPGKDLGTYTFCDIC